MATARNVGSRANRMERARHVPDLGYEALVGLATMTQQQPLGEAAS